MLWLVILSNLVHGFAYAFFFATVYIFVDENFPKDVRASAQSLFNLMILGIGQFVGKFVWGWFGDVFSSTSIVDGKPVTEIHYHQLFLVPIVVGISAAIILAIFFHPKAVSPEPEEVPLMEV